MKYQQQADSGALAVLELLASGAPHERLEQLLLQDHRGEPRELAEAWQQAARLGLAIQGQMIRRQHSEARMSALLSSARDVVAADLDTVLEVVTQRTRLLFGFDMAYVGVSEVETGAQVIRVADGHTSPLTVGLRLPSDVGLTSAVERGRSPFWTSDYLTDRRFAHDRHIDEVVRSENVHAILAIPLTIDRRPFGALFGAYRHTRSFNADEIAAMIAWGELVAAALEKARKVGDHGLPPEPPAYQQHVEVGGGKQAESRVMSQVSDEMEGAGLISRLAGCFEAALAGEAVALAHRCGLLLSGEVTIYDADGVTVGSGEGEPVQMAEGSRDLVRSIIPSEAADGTWTAPVQASGTVIGALRLRPDQRLPSGSRPLLGLAAQAAAVLLQRRLEPVPLDTSQTRDELLDDLLISPVVSPRKLERRVTAIGLNLADPHLLLVVRTPIELDERVEAWAAAYAHRSGGLCTISEGSLVLLVPGTDPGEAAKQLNLELARVLRTPATVGGAGPVSGIGAVAAARHEAARCAQALIALGSAGGCGSARELGFVGLLLAERQDTESFIASTLGPVLEYDRNFAGNLLDTLGAYFTAGGSPTHAAKELNVHPNTIARRLQHISTLLKKDWREPGRALEIQLALRLLHIREEVEGVPAPRQAASSSGS